MVVDVVQSPQKSNVYEYEKKTRTLCWRLYRNNVWMCEVCITSSSGGFGLGVLTVVGEMMGKRWSSGAPPVHALHGD